MHRVHLLGAVDRAHTALADHFEQLVGADESTRTVARADWLPGAVRVPRQLIDDPGGRVMSAEQSFDPPAEFDIASTGIIEIARPLIGRTAFNRVQEDFPRSGNVDFHGWASSSRSNKLCEIQGPKVSENGAHAPGGASPSRNCALSQARAYVQCLKALAREIPSKAEA